MEDDEPLSEKGDTDAKLIGIRDVLSRLLALEAKRHPDPIQMLADFSKATEDNVRGIAESEPLDQTTIAFQEVIQQEVDGLTAKARHLIEGGKV